VFESTFKSKFVEKYTNTAKNCVSISDYMITNREDEIASTCSKISSESEEFQVIFSCEGKNFIADDFALYRESSWRVNGDSESNSS